MVRIDHLDFENEKSIHRTEIIRAIQSTIAQLYIYIYIERERE
jgi:hypothetical protein